MPSTNSPLLPVALGVLSLLVVLYSLIIAQAILLGLAVVVAIWSVYVLYLLVVILGRIASALERLAENREEGLGVEYEN